jgi:thiol-disulfide isomerase/thioredoxin
MAVRSATDLPAIGPKSLRPEFLGSVMLGQMLNQQGSDASILKSGRPTYLQLWSIQCAPCIEEAPLFKKMIEDNMSRWSFIFVNTDTDPNLQTDIKKFQNDYFSNATNLTDPDWAFKKHLNVDAIPSHYLIDKNGLVAAAFVGIVINHESKLQTYYDLLPTEK